MKFKKTVVKDENFKGRKFDQISWLSDCGRYKIVEYFDTPRHPNKPIYYAYFKPEGWKNFGNCVNASKESFPNVKTAVMACEDHFAKTQPIPA